MRTPLTHLGTGVVFGKKGGVRRVDVSFEEQPAKEVLLPHPLLRRKGANRLIEITPPSKRVNVTNSNKIRTTVSCPYP